MRQVQPRILIYIAVMTSRWARRNWRRWMTSSERELGLLGTIESGTVYIGSIHNRSRT